MYVKGDKVEISTSAPSILASASANRTLTHHGEIIGPYNPRWERGKWRIRRGPYVEVWDESMIAPRH